MKNKVPLLWVLGYLGIGGNENSDKLAKAGAAMPFIGLGPSFGISE